MLMFDDLEQIKRRVAKLQSQADEAKGAKAILMKKLKEKYGCDTIEEAEELLQTYVGKEQKAVDKYLKKKKEFLETYKTQLSES